MFGLSKATVSESLNSLASGGFIQYIPSSTSKREKRIMATDKGHECHEEIRRAIEAFDLKAVSGLMDQEISELERLLRVVAANVGEDKA